MKLQASLIALACTNFNEQSRYSTVYGSSTCSPIRPSGTAHPGACPVDERRAVWDASSRNSLPTVGAANVPGHYLAYVGSSARARLLGTSASCRMALGGRRCDSSDLRQLLLEQHVQWWLLRHGTTRNLCPTLHSCAADHGNAACGRRCRRDAGRVCHDSPMEPGHNERSSSSAPGHNRCNFRWTVHHCDTRLTR